VILGIRPSDFEDASLADPGWPRMTAVADVTEPLGTEIHVIFAIGAPPVQHEDTRTLADDAATDDSAIPLAEGKSLWTARASARSRITAGSQVELSVDTANLHFFDPDSGLAIGHGNAELATEDG
jgi:multiple sugar transport system ATP-binding protein